MPKEMLTIVDRPLIQYAADEARDAGIEEMIFVTGRGKSTLVDYFDTAFELEATLRDKGKSLDALAPSRAQIGEIVTVRQQQPLGLGHAVWCAREIVGDEPFAVILPDDLMVPGALKPMVEAWEKLGGNLVATEEVAADKTASYGIITPGSTDGAVTEVRGLVEKPAPDQAPSRLGVIGRYILQPEVFDLLATQTPGAGGEIQLTDAMQRLMGNQDFHAFKYAGQDYDCGDKLLYLEAFAAMALSHPELAAKARAVLEATLKKV